MAFWVNTALIRGLPPLLDRLAADANVSAVYLYGWAAIEPAPQVQPGSLLLATRPHHERIVKLVEEHVTAVRALAHDGSAAITAAIDHYEHVDVDAAGDGDNRLPAPADRALLTASPAGDVAGEEFDDLAEPTASLQPPGHTTRGSGAEGHHPAESRADAGEFDFDLWSDLRNPSGACRQAIRDVTAAGAELGLMERPVDVRDELIRPVAGDWAGLLAHAEVFRNIRRTYGDMSRNLAGAEAAVARTWGGNAAAGCREFLLRFEASLTEAGDQLEEIAKHYEKVAHDVRAITAQLVTLITSAADEAAMVLVNLEGAADATSIFNDLYALHRLVYGGIELREAAERAVATFAASLDATPDLTTGLPAIPALPGHPVGPADPMAPRAQE